MKIHPEKKHIPFIILVIFGALLFFMGIANHYFFRTVTFDYGNYNYAFWDFAHFRISPMPTYPGNFLQDHFSLTLMFFIPLYWLLNWLTQTYTLIIIQYALVMTAAWYTWKLITLKTDNVWLQAGVLVYYFTLLGRYTTFSCDVNLAVISSCFIPVFLYAFEKKKYLISFLILIFSLLSRENIPLWFIAIFVVLIIQHRKEKKAVLYAVLGIVVSVVYFILLFKVFIPAVETGDKQFTLFNYAALGSNPGEALKFVISHPVETIKLFFVNHLKDPAYNGVKTEFYIVYLVSGGILLLLRPQYLVWFIPVVAQKVLNDSFIRWGISTYYSIEVVTLLPLSVFLTLAALKPKSLQTGLAVIACAATLFMTLYKLNPDNVKVRWTMNPSKERVYKKEFYKIPYAVSAVNRIIRRIPGDAGVSVSDHLFPHLSQRKTVYLFPKVDNAEYILFSVFDDNFVYSHMENEKCRNAYLEDPEWAVIEKSFPVFLLKKKSKGDIATGNYRPFSHRTDTLKCSYEVIDTIRKVVLFDDRFNAEQSKRVSSLVSNNGKNSLCLNVQEPFGTGVTFQDVENLEFIQAEVYYLAEEDRANIIATIGSDFYMVSGTPVGKNEKGWKKLELSFWVPQHLDARKLMISLWDGGTKPIYFDDFQIIKRYKK
jgi:uncharacterized membrane protein